MQIIHHRINNLDALQTIPPEHGAEIDVRYHENHLILHHDPFAHHIQPYPLKLEDFLKQYQLNGPLILNLKSEGIEEKIIDLMQKYNIKNWFFLDMSMPYFVKYAKIAANKELEGFHSANMAVRFSDKEPIEYALAFEGQAGWVWVDFFDVHPLNPSSYKYLKDANFKICLVSPELQKHDVSKIHMLRDYFRGAQIRIDAVCTKYPQEWLK